MLTPNITEKIMFIDKDTRFKTRSGLSIDII